MKIAIIGVTGMGGRAIAELLLARGHQVTGIARNPQKHAARPGLTLKAASVLQQKEISSVTRGHDCIVNAFSAGHDFSLRVYKDTIEGTRRTIRAAKDNSTPYLIHIGGAASLYVQPDMQVMDDPRFPVHYFRSMPPEHLAWLGEVTGMPQMQLLAAERRHELANPGIEPFQGPAWQGFEQFMGTATDFALLEGCRVAFDLFQHDHSFPWSFLSPPWLYRPGPATGRYRTVINELPVEDGAPAGISVDDLALAVADECERKKLLHTHWSVARAV